MLWVKVGVATADGGDDGLWAGEENGGACYDSLNCDTEKYTAQVNAQGLCGANDWRMPDLNELQSIADFGRIYLAIDTDYFPHTRSYYTWLASPFAYAANYTWYVYFNYGGDSNNGQTQAPFGCCASASAERTTFVHRKMVWASEFIQCDKCHQKRILKQPGTQFSAPWKVRLRRGGSDHLWWRSGSLCLSKRLICVGSIGRECGYFKQKALSAGVLVIGIKR